MQNSLGKQATQGFAWVVLQTFGVKAINVLGQILLAFLLLPKDFGKMGLAYTASVFVGALLQAGVREILVQRGAGIRFWVNTGFWLSGVLGFVGAVALSLAAPFLAGLYKTPDLRVMIWILAVAMFLGNLATVPRALLESRFEFKKLAIIGAIADSAAMILTIIFAFFGLGAFSFALGIVGANSVRLAMFWKETRPPLQARRPLRNWRFLSKNLVVLAGAGALAAVVQQGDYVVLGIQTDPTLVGLYFLAFTVSQQAILLFVNNLSPVLMSSFSHLQSDREKQLDVALRTAGLLAFVAVPLCCLQALLAHSFLAAFYPERWAPAAISATILSLGMIGRVVDPVSDNLIKAKGRFNLSFWIMGGQAVSLVISLFLIAPSFHLGWISAVVAFVLIFWGAFRFGSALRLAGGSALALVPIFGGPLLASAISLGLVWGVRMLLPPATTRPAFILEMLLVSVAGAALYLVIATKLMPANWRDAVNGLNHLGVSQKLARFRRAPQSQN